MKEKSAKEKLSGEQGFEQYYSNLYKENFNYKAIKEKIQQENPDIAMFVEFSDEHENNLKEFINENYPYYDKTNRSRIF